MILVNKPTPEKLASLFCLAVKDEEKRFVTFHQFCVESLERGDSSLMCGEELLLLYIF